MVAGIALERLEDAGEIFALIGQELRERGFPVRRSLSARIISRMASMRSPSKNMCSVRVRPMPAAPNAMAFSVCSGLSALVRTSRRVALAHHFMSWLKVLNFSVFCAALSPCEHAGDDLARRGLELAAVDGAAGAVDREEVAFLEGLAGDA